MSSEWENARRLRNKGVTEGRSIDRLSRGAIGTKLSSLRKQNQQGSLQAARKRGVVASPSGDASGVDMVDESTGDSTVEDSIGDDMVDESTGDSIGARVAAKNALRRAALNAVGANEEEQKDPAVDTAMDDLVSMLDEASIGGRRRLRGGGQTEESIRSLFSGLKAKAASLGGALDGAVATVVNNLGAVGAASGAIAVLNHPSFIGNMAQLFAEVLKLGTNEAITSTWKQWGTALLQLADATGTVAGTVAGQTAQGPVVPVAIAVLVTMIRAKKSNPPRSFAQVLKDDALVFTSGLARVVTGQMQAASEGWKEGERQMFGDQLKEVARGVKYPVGPGVPAPTGAPAFGMKGLVPASPHSVAKVGETARAIPSPSSIAAAAPLSGRHADARDMAEGAYTLAGMPLGVKGGRRRKTKKRASKKRRATRRQPVFVY
jgi:hypothetical protein